MKIPFNRPAVTGDEQRFLAEAIASPRLSGDGPFCQRCQAWLQQHLDCRRAMLTGSCTHALEMAALLAGVGPGDEVVVPSYTFVSSANAFAMRGASIVFVDVEPFSMNVQVEAYAQAIGPRTKVLVAVHYAGASCDMAALAELASKHGLLLVEDAAQAIGASCHGRRLGSFGHLATFSFHETKNLTSGGEGGALIINDDRLVAGAEIVREKGTDRSRFFRGQVDKYTWVGLGSSYLPSELQAAYLWAQLQHLDRITADRMRQWQTYEAAFAPLVECGLIELLRIPIWNRHNAHLFAIKLPNLERRGRFIAHLAAREVMAVFHYVPLHSSPAGMRHGRLHGIDRWTTSESDRLVRLPLWYGKPQDADAQVVAAVLSFFSA